MAAKGKRFSWMRLINNSFPNFAFNDPNDVDLSPQQADDLMTYQLNLPHPRYLGEMSFWVTEIVSAKSQSTKVHKTLIKHNIILSQPEAESSQGGTQGEQMTINTAGITKNFANQLALISVHAQRKLVGLLFFWEEECTRWKLLDEEEKEIQDAVAENGQTHELSIALDAVQMKKKLLPSQRAEGTANVGQGVGHDLPAYS